MADRSFDTFRDQMAASFPSLDSLLEGGAGGLENWWEAEKDLITEQLPAAKNILDQLNFVGLYQSNAATTRRKEIPFLPFRFNILHHATTLTREHFSAFTTRPATGPRDSNAARSATPTPHTQL